MNRGLRTRKEKGFWHIASLTFLGSLMVAGLLVVVAPLPARADNDKDSGHGHEDNDKGILAKIAALEAQVAALQTANTDQQNEINSLQASNTTLQNQLANAKNVLALDPFVSVDPNPQIGVAGPHITFHGANLHIVSGSGRTGDNLNNGGSVTGLGNLIIGYDEDPMDLTGSTEGSPTRLSPGDHGGSNNLIVGRGNKFTKAAFGGLVAGEVNTISNEAASVTGGFQNTASGLRASVSGGSGNAASGSYGSVTGGFQNTASGFGASVTGGQGNIADNGVASVLGGENNTAGGFFTVVLGGTSVTDNKDNSIAPQPPFP
jgi:hypothetical protein